MNLKCALGFHKFVPYRYGYPPYKKYWHEYEVCKKCGVKRLTIDDLFASTRPKEYQLDQDFTNWR